MPSLTNLKGGMNARNLIASGAAFHVMAISFTGVTALTLALGVALVVLHDEADGQCSILQDEWLLKFGWSSIGLSIFFGIVIIVTWVLNHNFVKMFPRSELQIVASTYSQ